MRETTMSHHTLTVLSNNPPGGRCKLYKQYAQELSSTFDIKFNVICPDEAHLHNAPGILIAGSPVRPADGVIIDPDDILLAIKNKEFHSDKMADLHKRLEELVEEMLKGL
jgi:cystathionine gamma-synthase